MIELLRLCPSRILSRIKITERIESHPVHILIHGIHVILQERFDKVIIIPAPGKPVLDHDLKHQGDFPVGQGQIIVDTPCFFHQRRTHHLQIAAGKQQAPDRILFRR